MSYDCPDFVQMVRADTRGASLLEAPDEFPLDIGTITFTHLEATNDGFLATATFNSNVCSFNGRFGIARRT